MNTAAPKRRTWPAPAAGLLLAILLVNVCVAAYVSAERTIYFWDFANYWNLFDHYTRLLRESPVDALRELVGSIRYSEYNGIAAFLLAPLGLVFGTSRLVYILGVTNLYAIPSAFAAAWAAAGHARDGKLRAAGLGFALVVTSAAIWHPVLRGFVAVGSLIAGFTVYGIWIREPSSRWRISRIALVGFLLAAMILFRRIHAYFVVGFGVAAFAVDVLPLLAARDTRRAGWIALLRLSATGLAAALVMLAVSTPMTVAMVKNDYTALYRMYQSGRGLPAQIGSGIGYFGLIPSLVATAGFLLALLDPRLRRAGVFWILQMFVAFITLLQVTDFHRHHYYVLVPGFLMLCHIALLRAGTRAAVVFLALCAAGDVLAFVPACEKAPGLVLRLFAPARAYPFVRDDLAEFTRMMRRLDTLPGAADPDRGVYVLSSSGTLNDDLVRASRRVLPPAPGPRAVIRATTNKDPAFFGFPRELLRAAVLVVADPVQVHLAGENRQAVIRAPCKALLDPRGFGGAYTDTGEVFRLEQGVSVRLFLRTAAPFTPAQLQSLSDHFFALKPEDPPSAYDFSVPTP